MFVWMRAVVVVDVMTAVIVVTGVQVLVMLDHHGPKATKADAL